MSTSLFIAYLLNITFAGVNAVNSNLAMTLFHCSMFILLAIIYRRNEE